jgi:site-specific recombinase XerD
MLHTANYRKYLHLFQTHIRTSKSLKSGDHYTGQVSEFLLFLEQQGVFQLKEVTAEISKQYYQHLINRKKKRGGGQLSPRTINDNMSTLRMFSNRMMEEKVIKRGLLLPENVQIEYERKNDFALIRNIATTAEIGLMFRACISPIDKTMLALAYGCGLRRSEIANLKLANIDFETGSLLVFRSKNNKTRKVPIAAAFIKMLKEYLPYRLDQLIEFQQDSDYFLLNHIGEACSGDQLNKRLHRLIKRTQNESLIQKKLTLHCLRHSIATHMMDQDLPLDFIRSFLGHSQMDTSLIYAKRRKRKTFYAV